MTRGTNVGFKVGVGAGPVSIDSAAGEIVDLLHLVINNSNLCCIWLKLVQISFTGFGISPADGVEEVAGPQVEGDLPVVWLTDEEWAKEW